MTMEQIMKAKMNVNMGKKSGSSSENNNKRNSTAMTSEVVGHCEIRPCGMLVQKRSSEAISATIRVRIKYGSSYHDMSISSQASFGELKKKIAERTGLHPEEQKLVFKDKERDSKTFLDIARVKDGSKIVLTEDIASRERRCLEMMRNAKVDKASKSLTDITLEVDKLQGQVKGLEKIMGSRGGEVAEIDIDKLIESLMSKLIQLDGIVAEGDLKMKRRMQVRRVQKHIETLDVLKLQFSKPNKSMEVKIAAKPWLSQQTINRSNCSVPKPGFHRPLMNHSEPKIVVTTKWETFD